MVSQNTRWKITLTTRGVENVAHDLETPPSQKEKVQSRATTKVIHKTLECLLATVHSYLFCRNQCSLSGLQYEMGFIDQLIEDCEKQGSQFVQRIENKLAKFKKGMFRQYS